MTNYDLQNKSTRSFSRRGTIMIFVLGVLTLLALVGLVLIARTHGESRRIKIDSVASSSRSAMDGVVHSIQETLRQDIWGPNPDPSYPVPLNHQVVGNLRESNEPWDAPGASDRWLASTLPYMLTDDSGNPVPQNTGNPASSTENDVLAWNHVSYLGIDLLQPDGPDGQQPFAWKTNSRGGSSPVSYPLSSIDNIPILQTPPDGIPGDLIPGSTTNVTIARAREVWDSEAAALSAMLGGITPRFPYFDTNSDGAVDLYDADGDGIPDSPISFVIPMDTSDPNASKQLYAVVRVVDHAAKLNANVASSIYLPSGSATELTFDESLPGLQRRGARATELLLDDTVHPDDRFTRTRQMVGYRSGDDPVAYDEDVVRRVLIGGRPGAAAYNPYGLLDEASLRHRGRLVPYDRRFEAAAAPGDYDTIDRALRGTLEWTRAVDPAGSYIGAAARWTRLNANYGTASTAYPYEGDDDAGGKGWRSMLREDEPYAVRRPLFTTISREVMPPPPGVVFDGASSVTGLPVDQATFVNGSNTSVPMAWPVIDSANSINAPDCMRVLPIDLNMRTPSSNPADILAAKEQYIQYLAAAMYKALEGVQAYQGQWVMDNSVTPRDETINREYYAWQFAINAADYRDADNTPTIIEWPAGSGHYLYGAEKQPFFTEAYAYLTASADSSGPSIDSQPGDQWFSAVELYVPPYWRVPTVDPNNPGQPILYLRSSASPALLPINSFQLVPGGQTLSVLDGGPGGQYFVFCGALTNAPDPTITGYYRNAAFNFANDGNGKVELVYSPTGNASDPFTHAIDLIGPAYSGDPLAGPGTSSGAGAFAKNRGFPANSVHQFSLLRSTHGWRFTIGWQVYTEAPTLSSGDPPFRASLGAANDTNDSLDLVLPPSVWPGRVALNGNEPPESFGPGLPFDPFDSPVDINRLLMIGSLRRDQTTDPPFLVDHMHGDLAVGQTPATILLAETAAMDQAADNSGSDLTSMTTINQRIALGHIDFVKAKRVGAPPTPWTLRLLSYFTTRGLNYDGIDNDGDGAADLSDPTESAKVLNRVAGRININTAPVSVLRAVPFMSLLPTSAEFAALGSPTGDPAADYSSAAPGTFYDLATAIVAAREGRHVPIRLPTGDPGVMQTVAVARIADIYPSDAPGLSGFYRSVADLERLSHIVDGGPSSNDSQFRTDRFYYPPTNPALALNNHKIAAVDPDLGLPDSFSPDFRSRRADNNRNGSFSLAEGDDYVADYVPILNGQPEFAGQRARDIYLDRWANLLTVRSDVFTAYIALLDDQGRYVQRCQVTLDRGDCFREHAGSGQPGAVILPRIVIRTDGSYEEEVH